MNSEERHQLIQEIKELIVDKKGGNILTLMCLIATMTDSKLKEFHLDVLKT